MVKNYKKEFKNLSKEHEKLIRRLHFVAELLVEYIDEEQIKELEKRIATNNKE